MDAATQIDTPPEAAAARPRIALVLQGGGALGAYQAGVYEALHAAGLEPAWVAGVSIGAINASLIAGNPPERRLDRLREFWETVTERPIWPPPLEAARKARDIWSASVTTLLGQPGFFTPNAPNPWASPPGARTATSFYDNAPLRETLRRLVDFDRVNAGPVRLSCGAVNVATGDFAYFDTRNGPLGPEHVIASGALPPALPMEPVGDALFWDGGLVSNTPLQHVLDEIGSTDTLIFQVDLFSASGPVPRDMYDVLGRQKDIQFSSRTRLVTDAYRAAYRRDAILSRLLARMPDADLTETERDLKARLARLPAITILELVYQQAVYEGDVKDYDFSRSSMLEHWAAGVRDAQATIARPGWLAVRPEADGIEVHDIHRDR
jgi:NTE family protein